MKGLIRKTFIIAGIVFIMTAPLQAQSNQATADKKNEKQDSLPAMREELKTLRDMVAMQQREIQELKLAVEQLVTTSEAAKNSTATSPAPPTGSPESQAASSDANAAVLPAPEKKAASPKAAELLPQAGWDGEHFFIRSSDGRLVLQPIGYLQFDQRSYSGNGAPPATFLLRRGRFGFDGEWGGHYEFTLLADFADRNSALAREFSLNINYRPELQFRFGQFKAPFSQEDSLVSDIYTDFVERSLANNLAPGYTPGFEIHGELLGKAIRYQVGEFNAKGYLNPNTTSTPESIARLRFYPWQNTSNKWLKGFAIGGAVADGRTHNGTSVSGVMPTGTFTFFQAQPVNGKELRTNSEMTWIKGPFALRMEYDQTNQARLGLGPSNGDLPGVVAKGYSADATFLLTGEDRPENGQPTPHSEFLGKDRKGRGAWELKFRYSNLQMESGASRNRADQFSTGVNWYLNSYMRYMFDFNVERIKNPVSSPVPLAPQSFLSILQRIQFRF